MMGTKARIFAPIAVVSLEDLVPSNHFYRHLDHVLDLSFVRDLVKETYAHGGRPSIDPVVFFKLQHAQRVKMGMIYKPFHLFIYPQRSQEDWRSKAYVFRLVGLDATTVRQMSAAWSPRPLQPSALVTGSSLPHCVTLR